MDPKGQRSREQETREKMLTLSKGCFLKKSAKSYKEAIGKTLNSLSEPERERISVGNYTS